MFVYQRVCFTSNRNIVVPLQSLLLGVPAEVPPLPTTEEELILSEQEMKEMRMRLWPSWV